MSGLRVAMPTAARKCNTHVTNETKTMKLEAIEEFQVSARWTITRGSIVRLAGGGPEYRGADGQPHRYTLPGRWRIRAIFRSGRRHHRHFVEVHGLDLGGTYGPLLVDGKSYRSAAGLLVRPYRIKKPRSRRPVAAGPAR